MTTKTKYSNIQELKSQLLLWEAEQQAIDKAYAIEQANWFNEINNSAIKRGDISPRTAEWYM